MTVKYRPQNEEFRVYKRGVGALQDFFWRLNEPICNQKSLQNSFLPQDSPEVPHAFTKVMVILKDYGSAHSRKATGKEPLYMETVEKVKNFHR